MTDPFAAIAEERRRVADFLENLNDEQWTTQSCCDAWTIEGLAAHLMVGPVMGLRASMRFMLKARGNLAAANVLTARAMLDEHGRDGIVGLLRSHANNRFTPPGFGVGAPLTDITIHGQDMARPLGMDLGVPTERWRTALETATSPRFGVVSVRKHLKDLRFEANDLEFNTGDGAVVTGAAKDLAHAMWGRAMAVNALDGPGVDTLRSRLG